jgi:hypothetical protein
VSDPRKDWKQALQPAPECVPIERLGGMLTPAENEHVAHCVRCQTELALLREFTDGETSADERPAVDAIVDRLERGAHAAASNVVPLASRRKTSGTRMLAAAAMLVIALGLGYVAINREPPVSITQTNTDVYRSSRIRVIVPATEEVPTAPVELRWEAIPGATSYEVKIVEVDQTMLWRTSTRESRVAIPPQVVALFVPGKTIQWHVTALRGAATVADSGVQRFRVAVK